MITFIIIFLTFTMMMCYFSYVISTEAIKKEMRKENKRREKEEEEKKMEEVVKEFNAKCDIKYIAIYNSYFNKIYLHDRNASSIIASFNIIYEFKNIANELHGRKIF